MNIEKIKKARELYDESLCLFQKYDESKQKLEKFLSDFTGEELDDYKRLTN